LIFAPELAVKINDLIIGQYIFSTNAPNGLTLNGTIPSKVKYMDQKEATPPTALLIVTGIMSEKEANDIKALSAHPLWAPAVDRVLKQATTFYSQTLAKMLPADGSSVMLKTDTPDTPAEKGLYFMKYFIPTIQAALAKQLVQSTVSDVIGLAPVLTSYLLSWIRSSDGNTAMDDLLALKTVGLFSPSGWSGYLIPPSTDAFNFTVTSDTQPAPMTINGIPVSFPNQSDDPSNLWSTDKPVNVVAGTLYALQLNGITVGQLAWSTATSPAITISSSALLPTLSSDKVTNVLSKVFKVSTLVQGFNLSLDEVVYFYDHGQDFSSDEDGMALELDSLTLGTWKRLQAYVAIRDKLPKLQFRLIDLFG
jgi:hypothetical protein